MQLHADPRPGLDDRTSAVLAEARAAQLAWRMVSVVERLRVVQRFRHLLASEAGALAESLRTDRSPAEMLSAEVIPLLDSAWFLEREAPALLSPRGVGRRGRPLWLAGQRSEVIREPWGLLLVIAPSNYPLLLPGLQTLQALAAGNAVLLKPGISGTPAARSIHRILTRAGLPDGLLQILPEDPTTARAAIRLGVDKVVFTGSAQVGRRILTELADSLTPATMELSGCDACLVRQDANLSIAAQAVAFGLGLNAGRTCIAPRRIFVHRSVASQFEGLLSQAVGAHRQIQIDVDRHASLVSEVREALGRGAHLIAGSLPSSGAATGPMILGGVTPGSPLLQHDFFAPVAVLQIFNDDQQALALAADCPFALGTTIFSQDMSAATRLARDARAGVVTVNDMIVPTADPRLPFGGLGASGFGVTRGPEGLLEMTRPKVLTRRRSSRRPYFAPTHPSDARLFAAYAMLVHGRSLRERLTALADLINFILRRKP